jgi:hypothetical protein
VKLLIWMVSLAAAAFAILVFAIIVGVYWIQEPFTIAGLEFGPRSTDTFLSDDPGFFYEKTSDGWYHDYWGWHLANYALGVIIVLGSLAVASTPPFLEKIMNPKNLAFVVAASSALFTYLSPAEHAATYSRAFIGLDAALNEYYDVFRDDKAKAAALRPKLKTAYDNGIKAIFEEVGPVPTTPRQQTPGRK